jgi:ABC-2 type transport system ATP-binding protein
MSMGDATIDVVVCQGLVKRYGTRAALQGFDLRVKPGEVFGVVGANGGSKTTILRIMAGLLQPDAGTCSVFGQAPARVRARVGYMAQGQALYGHLTVAENLQVRAMLYGLPDVARVVAVSLHHFGLARYSGTRVDQLSGGWARRAGFAAALVHSPGLLLLDEPTIGLDAVARQDVWRHVLQLAAGGVTVVVSTHDLAEAERFSRLAFLVDGVVRAQGTVEEVVRQSDTCSFVLRGPEAARAMPDALGTAGIVAAYPSAGALRVVTRSAAYGQAAALAQRHGLVAANDMPSLDDAAQSLMHATGAGW